MLLHERFHGSRLFCRDVLVGMRDASEHVRKSGEVPRTVGLQMVERVESLAKRSKLILLGCADAKPRPYRLQRHGHCLTTIVLNLRIDGFILTNQWMKVVNS